MPTERDPKAKELLPELNAWPTKYATTSWDGAWKDSWDTDTDMEALEDALVDAKHGLYRDLIDLIADTAYPEDPDMAIKFINKRMLTDEVINKALIQCNAVGADTVLLELFDVAYCEA